MIYHTIYVSSTSGLSKTELNKILDTAQTFNGQNDVSGFLLHDGSYFVQYLEGSKDKLDYLLNKISKDSRHSCFTILEYKEINKKVCPDWKMKLLLLDTNSTSIPNLPIQLEESIHKLISNIFILNRPV